jgi:hypothetical protein
METFVTVYLPTGCHFCRVSYEIAGGNPHIDQEPQIIVVRAVDQHKTDVLPLVCQNYSHQRQAILEACRAHLQALCERSLGLVRTGKAVAS